MPEAPAALEKLRVVETGGVSVALAGRWLADLGAEVFKIEPPGGDPARRLPPFSRDEPERSFFFEYYHAGKKSLVVDAKSRPEREALADLVSVADVWLDTTPPGERNPFGLDEGALRIVNPRLVVVSVTPFGRSGPFAGFRANDLVAQAAGGMIYTNGHAEEPPVQGYGLQAHHAASAYATIGALLALVEREASGRGQVVELSIQEAVAGAVEEASAAWNAERRIERRHGTLHWSRYFHVGRARDGWVLECTLGDWTTLREWMNDAGDLAEFAGPEWDETTYRRDHAERLFEAIDRWVGRWSAREILDGAQLRRLAFGAVRRPEMLRADEQLTARGYFAPIPGSEDWGSIRFPGPPFRMSRTPLRTRRPAPSLGTTEWPKRRGLFPEPARGEPREPRRALEGVRVLDFTHVVAGPVATRILADHGAEVVKIERKSTLDQGDRRRGFFGNLNRGKKSLILDLSTPRGIAIAKRLAMKSDVVIDNFSARVMPNLGLDYEGLRALRDDVIAVSMSGFGKTGPQRDYVSFGPTLQALCGHTMLMRHPGGEPAGWGFSHADMCGGLTGAIAVLAALRWRAKTGEGQFVDLAQYEGVVSFMGPALVALAENACELEPMANRSQEGETAPHGVYRCAGDDRWVAIAAASDDEWRAFGEAVGEAWARDARFATNAGRLDAIAELDAAIASWTAIRSPEEVMHLLQNRGVAAYVVANGEDLCARDPQLQARGYWVRLPHEDGGVTVLDGIPPRLSRTPGRVDAAGPLHGEHTDAVLGEIAGLSADEIAELREAGVVA